MAYRYKAPTAEQIAFVERCKAQNIMQSSGAQPSPPWPLALCAALDPIGVRYWLEEITWYDGDCFVLSDFWLPDDRISIGIDGAQHGREQIRDIEKAVVIFAGQRLSYREVLVWRGHAPLTRKPGKQGGSSRKRNAAGVGLLSALMPVRSHGFRRAKQTRVQPGRLRGEGTPWAPSRFPEDRCDRLLAFPAAFARWRVSSFNSLRKGPENRKG